MRFHSIQKHIGEFFNTNFQQSPSPEPAFGMRPRGSGPSLRRIDTKATMRLCFQNVRGAHPATALDKWVTAMERIVELNISVLGCSELNTNVGMGYNEGGIRQGIKNGWRQSKTVLGSCRGGSTESHLRGGTLLSVANGYENRVVDGGMDPTGMGRFGFVTMLGKGGAKLTIISLYRPCEGSPKGNEGTIWKQQWARAQVLKLGEKYDPRTNILLDIAKFVKTRVDHDFIIGGDFNGVADDDSSIKGSIPWLLAECGLVDTHEEMNAGPFPSTFDRGSRRIDQIYATSRLVDENFVLLSSMGSYDSVFLSDHQPIFLDFDAQRFFDTTTRAAANRRVRLLRSNDPRLVEPFIACAIKSVVSQSLDTKLEVLAAKMRGAGEATRSDEAALNEIDKALTALLIKAEKSLSPTPRSNRTTNFSPEFDIALRRLAYWRRRVTALTSTVITQASLDTFRCRAEIPIEEVGRRHPRLERAQAHRHLRRVRRDGFAKRQQNLVELAEAISKGTSTDPAAAIKQLKNKEKMAGDYAAIRGVLNAVTKKRGGGGLTSLRVTQPDTDHDEPTTRVLLDENEIAETLRDFNTKHYGQANKTVFGGGDYYTLLTDKPMTNPIYKEILEGSFAERPDLTAAQKLWSRHMRSKVPDGTDKERRKLAEPMTLTEWRKFFLRAKEGTTSSVISGLHRGIYKACATDDVLATMQLTIVSLAFEFGLKGVRRWHKAVDYILEKGKGPVLGKLRTIKLLECDLNFGLKWAFAWRLGSFAEKHDLYNHSQHALPGKWCHTPALNKTLTFDLLMQTHHDGAFGDYDAIASFDRLAMSLMIPLALRVGAVLSHAVCCYNIFQAMEYSISTGHGISPFTYTSTAAHRLQGSGQGGSQSPILCTNSSDVILDAVDEEGHPISLDHPSDHSEWRAIRYSDQFVDDQSNGAVYPGDDAEECTRKLEINANLSNSLLNASGGGVIS